MPSVLTRSDSRSRFIAATPSEVFAAMSNQSRVARWWGPNGFTNTIHVFEFTSGGKWVLTMHGPDGNNYPNESRFTRVIPDQVFEIEHLDHPHFILTLELTPSGAGTEVAWCQTFDTEEQFRQISAFVGSANAQNLERLAAEVQRGSA